MFESFSAVFAVPFENDVRERGHAKPDCRGVEQGSVTADDSGFFEALQATADLRRREVDLLAERGIGGVALALQRVEQGQVVAVDGDL